jgi:hypothetical protein
MLVIISLGILKCRKKETVEIIETPKLKNRLEELEKEQET